MSDVKVTFNQDGTGMIGSATLQAADTQRLIAALMEKGLLGGVMQTSGNETVDNACQDLIKAQKSGDEQEIARGFNRVLRAVQHVLHLRKNIPATKEPTPRLDQLPEGGAAAADTLKEFPVQSANARFDAPDLRTKSQRIGALKLLSTTLREGDTVVTDNLKPLALEVAGAVRTVHDVVDPVADDDDRLVELTDIMTSYLKDPAVKAQDTKHLVAKHKKKITDQVTQQVQSDARQQARDQLSQQLTDQVKGWLDDKKK